MQTPKAFTAQAPPSLLRADVLPRGFRAGILPSRIPLSIRRQAASETYGSVRFLVDGALPWCRACRKEETQLPLHVRDSQRSPADAARRGEH